MFKVNHGTLLDSFTPPVNPPAEIEDPEDSMPADWVRFFIICLYANAFIRCNYDDPSGRILCFLIKRILCFLVGRAREDPRPRGVETRGLGRERSTEDLGRVCGKTERMVGRRA